MSPPQYGYIENVLPSPGFEKSNMGISIGRGRATVYSLSPLFPPMERSVVRLGSKSAFLC